ncbi:MAG: ATP-binding protein [Bacteroidetes bacterium]|nr:ATP-binding protein [Bacteroidota bacterium]
MKYFQKDKNPDVQKLLTFFKKELSQKDLSSDTRFLNNLYISVFLNLLTTDREFSSLGGFIGKVIFSKTDTIKSYIFNFFKNIPNVKYRDRYLKQEIPIDNHKKKSKVAIEFFNYIEKLLENKSFKIEKYNRANRSTIKYSINEESFEELTKFLDLYINLKGLTDFLDFNWRNLSSGEQSMFTFISRFYHLKHHQIQHEDLKKNMVILIDEWDIYFHPAWQKKFFQITIDYLSKLLKDHNLQFIFTANTPFITSDLPNQM